MYGENRFSSINKKLHICIIIFYNNTYMSRIEKSILFEKTRKCFDFSIIYDDEGFGTVFANLYLIMLLAGFLECVLS